MVKFIKRYATKIGARVVEDKGNLYVTKGDASIYPCVVAHTDTVHSVKPLEQYSVYKSKVGDNTIYFGWNPVKDTFTGIGGDDKVGIYLALSALRDFPVMKAAFFRDEEIGCIGSSLADMTFFNDVAFVMQGDRRGNGDFVDRIGSVPLFGKNFSDAIAPILKTYKYRLFSGAMTDVQELKTSGLDVACANFSCGYHDPHSAQEYINIEDVANTMGMLYTIITELGDRKWDHTYEHTSTPYYQPYKSKGAVYANGEWEEYRGESSYKPTARTTTYRDVVSDDGPLSSDFDVYLRLGETGDCPLCKQSHMILFDDDLGLFYCDNCVTYIQPAG